MILLKFPLSLFLYIEIELFVCQTLAEVSSFISDNNISVGFDLQNNKLQITINLESAKAEGANFSSRLLNVSQIK